MRLHCCGCARVAEASDDDLLPCPARRLCCCDCETRNYPYGHQSYLKTVDYAATIETFCPCPLTTCYVGHFVCNHLAPCTRANPGIYSCGYPFGEYHCSLRCSPTMNEFLPKLLVYDFLLGLSEDIYILSLHSMRWPDVIYIFSRYCRFDIYVPQSLTSSPAF